MKTKTINKILKNKFNHWVDSIKDEKVKYLAKNNMIITGGAIVSLLLNEEVNDFDLYCRNQETAKALAEYYVGKYREKHGDAGMHKKIYVDTQPDTNGDPRVRIVVQSGGIATEKSGTAAYDYFEGREEGAAGNYVEQVTALGDANCGDNEDDNDDGPGESYDPIRNATLENETRKLARESNKSDGKYLPVFLSSNAITLSGSVQIVLRFFGEAEEIHKNYDFVHCTSYWTSWDEKLTLRPEAMEAILAKELRYVGSKYPVCSVIRLRKFIKRGWSINAGQILKMLLQISLLNLHDPKVLQDQLIGVDVAYFREVIQKVTDKNPEKIDNAYLIEVIEAIF